MNKLLVQYKLFDAPKIHYISVEKGDLMGAASILEIIAAWHNYPASSTDEIRILDLTPQ